MRRFLTGRDLWQWGAGLLSANNITIRDSWVDGGDDNVCIKNDTSNVLAPIKLKLEHALKQIDSERQLQALSRSVPRVRVDRL